MLYDILPPLVLFASIGGIVFVVTRVVARMKRQELSHAIQLEGARDTHSEQILNSGEGKITLMKSRLAAVGSSAKQSLVSLKNLPKSVKERRAEKQTMQELDENLPGGAATIQRPRSSWRDQLTKFSKGTGRRLQSLSASLSSRLKQVQATRATRRASRASTLSAPIEEEKPVVRPVTLRRVETPEAISAPRMETTAQRLQALVRSKRATTSPVQEAQAALEKGDLTQAEDVLIPYIAKHPRNTMAYLILADVALARGAWDEAVEILEQVIRLDAATPGAYAKLGNAALSAGHMTRALEALQRAHDAEPNNVSVLKNLLKIAQRRDDRVLQKTVLQKMMVLAPDDPEVHLAAEALEAREQTPAA